MTTKRDDTRRELAKDAAAGATTLAVGVAAGLSVAVAGVAAAGPVLIGTAAAAICRRNNRRLERWYVSMARKLGRDPGAVREELEARMAADGDKVAATILESVDCLMRAIDDAIVPSLGALAAKYIADDKAADRFFRGVGRLLQDLSATELLGLRQMSSNLAEAAGEHLQVVLFRDLVRDPNAPVTLEVTAFNADGTHPPETHSPAPADAARLFHLLKVHELGTDNPSGFMDNTSGPQVLRTERSTMQRLLELIEVEVRPD
jgi:hypothetical protein